MADVSTMPVMQQVGTLDPETRKKAMERATGQGYRAFQRDDQGNINNWNTGASARLGFTRAQDAEDYENKILGNYVDQIKKEEADAQENARKSADAQAYKNKQYDYANEFRSKIPEFTDKLTQQAGSEIGSQLKGTLKNIRTQDSSRGLLYSGISAGRQGAARAAAGSNLAQTRGEINAALQDQAEKLQDQAIKQSIDFQKTEQGVADSVYGQALSNMQARMAGLSAIGGAAGMGLGAYFGSRGK